MFDLFTSLFYDKREKCINMRSDKVSFKAGFRAFFKNQLRRKLLENLEQALNKPMQAKVSIRQMPVLYFAMDSALDDCLLAFGISMNSTVSLRRRLN